MEDASNANSNSNLVPAAAANRAVEHVRNESPSTTSRSMSPALPADDGMEPLRQQMREIHKLAISTEEKARKMHLLMTRDYMAMKTESAIEATSSSKGLTDHLLPQTNIKPDNPYNVQPADVEPSYCPVHVPLCDDEDMPEDDSRRALGCEHYTRNVKVQCHDCNLWFTCRHCHDTSPNLPYPHQLNRTKTKNMLCMLCKTPQPAGEECTTCGQETAYYYCNKCKLWDNDSTKRIYHCDDCGICRRGEGLGKDYVHCKRCNVCISISTSSTHPCIERATDCDCPLCLDYLFSSQLPVVSLLCGHYMHATCYKDLMTVTYRCPVCNKSAVNMELQWRKLDDEIRVQPMPEEDFEPLTPNISRPGSANPEHRSSSPIPRPASANPDHLSASPAFPASTLSAPASPSLPPRRHVPRKVWVACNDCGGRGWSPFHWLGLKCAVCDGYNTTQTTPLGNVTSIRSLPGTYHVQRQHDFTGVDAIRSFGDGTEVSGAAGLGVDLVDVRADSAYGAGNGSPAQLGVPPPPDREWEPNAPPGRSYFLRAEQEESASNRNGLLRPDRAISASASEMFGGVPYEMVMRLGRSLSPMRYYMDGLDLNGGEGPVPRHRIVERSERESTPDGLGERTSRQHKDAEAITKEEGKRKGVSDSFWGSDGRFLGVFQGNDDEFMGKKNDGDDEDEEEDEEDDDDDDEEDDEDSEDDDDEDDSNASDNEEDDGRRRRLHVQGEHELDLDDLPGHL